MRIELIYNAFEFLWDCFGEEFGELKEIKE
jgi:hypothetical protein